MGNVLDDKMFIMVERENRKHVDGFVDDDDKVLRYEALDSVADPTAHANININM